MVYSVINVIINLNNDGHISAYYLRLIMYNVIYMAEDRTRCWYSCSFWSSVSLFASLFTQSTTALVNFQLVTTFMHTLYIDGLIVIEFWLVDEGGRHS